MGRMVFGLGLLLGGAKLATAQSAVTFHRNACTADRVGVGSVVTVFSDCKVDPGDSVVACLAVERYTAPDNRGGYLGVLCYDDGLPPATPGVDPAPTPAPSNIWVKERDTWAGSDPHDTVRLVCFDALRVPNSFSTITCLHASWTHSAGMAVTFQGAAVREPADRFQLESDFSPTLSGLHANVPPRVYPNDMLIMAVASSVGSDAPAFTPTLGWNLPAPTPFASSGSATGDRQIQILYHQVSDRSDNGQNFGDGSFAAAHWWAAGVFALSAGPTPTPTEVAP